MSGLGAAVRSRAYARRVIAKVEPLTTARALRGPFDYRLPADMAEVGVGSMLVVPFGRRRVLGVVTDVAETSELPPERLVEPVEALEEGVPAELVRLGLWVAREYCSTPARGLALVLPPGTGLGKGRRTRRRSAQFATLTRSGESALGGGEEAGRIGPRQQAALELLAGGPQAVAAVARETGVGHAAVRSLEARGLVDVALETVARRPQIGRVGIRRAGGEPELTSDQHAALELILARMDDADAGGGQLLHGVTGSGKTEVYLRAVAAALQRGRSAIVLVPEIALTPQIAGRFEDRFGDVVAVLHSKLAAGERYDEWLRMRSGEARVCVGPRSAVFAPLSDLGLIVVDEEHDGSYKQESDPRYDARAVAARRAQDAGAALVAGTATPRPESFVALERVRLPERVDGRALPAVELLGMANQQGPLHEGTRDALEQVARRGEKAVILLNRRGWSAFLSCRGCGRVWGCPPATCRSSCIARPTACRATTAAIGSPSPTAVPIAARCRWRVMERAPSASSRT